MNTAVKTIKAFVENNFIAVFFLFFSLFLTYNYTDFSKNMSIGVGHVYMAKSLALSRNFNVTEYWGNAGVDVFELDGEYYAAYAPLNSVIMSIPYFLLQVVYYFYTNLVGPINGDVSLIFESLSFSLPSTLSTFLLAVFVKKFLQRIKIRDSVINLSLFCMLFSTILLNYSVSFFNHNHSALLVFLAFFVLTKSKNIRKKDYLLSGVFIGLSFLNEHPTILFSLAVLVF